MEGQRRDDPKRNDPRRTPSSDSIPGGTPLNLEVRKHWLRNEYVRTRLRDILRADRLEGRDVHFLGGLCTGGVADPKKRGMKASVKPDGVLLAFHGNGKEGDQFGIQSCVYASAKNPNVVQAFHFASPAGASALRCPSVRDFLERNVPRWSSMRCSSDAEVQDFLTKRTHGSESFLRVEGAATSRSAGDVVEVRYRKGDAVNIAGNLQEHGASTLHAAGGETVLFRSCSVNKAPGFSAELGRGELKRSLLVSHGLFSVILEPVVKRDPYVTGLRSLAKAVSHSMFELQGNFTGIPCTFTDREEARRRISDMALITTQPIRKGSPFETVATACGVKYWDGAETKRYLFSAHGSSNSPAVFRELDIKEEDTRGLMRLGMTDEEIQDCLLAANAAAGAPVGVRLLNAQGYTAVASEGFFGKDDAIDIEFQFKYGENEDLIQAQILPSSKAVNMLGGVAEACKGDSAQFVSFLRNGAVYALYAVGGMRLLPTARVEADMGVPGMASCAKGGEDASTNLRAAVARLCYIVAACRADPELLPFEHTLRAVWLCTERNRPEVRGNVHDICILSMVGRCRSDCMHYSVLPYIS